MSFRNRMAAIVGDQNSVARYLVEKAGHTALIAWALLLFLPPLAAALVATFLYLVIGKVIWHRNHPTDPVSPKDVVFDAWTGGLVVVFAFGPLTAAGAFVIWALVFLVLDNNAWGSPS